MTSNAFASIDWAAWRPRVWATLLFIVHGGRVLLIDKKKGLGAGKINAPGGRVEAGETPEEAAVRETREEVGVTPRDVRFCGELLFQAVDGYSERIFVFMAGDCDGEARETDEAAPRWTPVDAIPYDDMWEGDRFWIPLALEGTPFEGRFLFDGDRMLGHAVTVLPRDPSLTASRTPGTRRGRAHPGSDRARTP
jgi:8-oxo-dGTP diphosphatase